MKTHNQIDDLFCMHIHLNPIFPNTRPETGRAFVIAQILLLICQYIKMLLTLTLCYCNCISVDCL